MRTRAKEIQRLEKLLEDAGIKLSSVAADISGVSGRAMLEALINGQRNPVELAELAKRPGNPYLKGALGIAAMSAARSKDTYLVAKYRRIAARCGPVKAIVRRRASPAHRHLEHAHQRCVPRRPRR